MLSQPNRDLADRDPALPGLRLLLDTEALAAALGTGGVSLRHLRYKPQTSCVVAVVTAEGHWLRLRALTPDRYAEKHPAKKGRLGAHAIELGMLDDDRAVPGLRRFWPERRRPKVQAEVFGESHLADAQLVPLSYRLGRRLVARLDHPLGAALLKLHARSRFAQAQTGALWAGVLGHGELLRACAVRCAVATRWQTGSALTSRSGPEGFAAAGAALADVHMTPHELPFVRSRADEIASAIQTLDDAAHLLPGVRDRLTDLSARLTAALAAAPADPGPIHGDFSADQVVMTTNGACLIDWDRAGTGDRGGDLGTALARLEADSLWGNALADEAQRAGQALLEGYSRRRALPASVETQRLMHLALLMCEPFRRQLVDWPATMVALIDTIERGLDRLVMSGPSDPALPQLATLCDPVGAQALLDATDLGRLGAAPRLLRHKPGRRALVEITAIGADGPRRWLAKTRSKRPDHASPGLHEALRAAGFDGRPGAAFGVPQALSAPGGFRAFLMEHVAGEPLGGWLRPDADRAPFRATGRALAALHASEIDPGRIWRTDDELGVADRALEAVSQRYPEVAPRIADLQHWAESLAHNLSTASPVLLHRDFHPDQALIEPDRVWLIDLDLVARGDRHIDLGNMLAHLTEYGLRHCEDPGAFLPHAEAFLDGYADAGGCWSDQVLAAMHDLSLLRHLDICGRIAGRNEAFPIILDHLLTHLAADCRSHDIRRGGRVA